MPTTEFLAYEGVAYRIEWFYNEGRKSEALQDFLALTPHRQDRILLLFKRMGDFGRISDSTKFRNEGDKIFAFKAQSDRLLCFFAFGRKIIITNIFEKKTRKLPQKEKDRALKYKDSFEGRVKEDSYYL